MFVLSWDLCTGLGRPGLWQTWEWQQIPPHPLCRSQGVISHSSLPCLPTAPSALSLSVPASSCHEPQAPREPVALKGPQDICLTTALRLPGTPSRSETGAPITHGCGRSPTGRAGAALGCDRACRSEGHLLADRPLLALMERPGSGRDLVMDGILTEPLNTVRLS